MYGPLQKCRSIEPCISSLPQQENQAIHTFATENAPKQVVVKERLARQEARFQPSSSPQQGFVKKGGRPVTWIGGGGMDPKKLANLGVPQLRTLFSEVFGEQTASNNAAWLRRKLSESPDGIYGQGRCVTVRARDLGAAIWNSNSHLVTQTKPGAGSGHHHHQQHYNSSGGGVTVSSGCQSPTGSCSTSTASGSSSGHHHHQQLPAGARGGQFRRCRAEKRTTADDSRGEGESLREAGDEEHLGGARGGRWSGTGGGQRPGKRHVIAWEEFGDDFIGASIEVYWPEDNTWWAAKILQLDVAARRMQLLYSNMQQEDVTDGDFDEMLMAGHLAKPAAPRPKPVRRPSKRRVASAPHSPSKHPHSPGLKRTLQQQQQEEQMFIKEEHEEHLPSSFAAALPDERENMLKRQRLCCPGDEQQQDDDGPQMQEGEDEDDPVAAAIEAFTSSAPAQGLNSALAAVQTSYGGSGADGGAAAAAANCRVGTPFDSQQSFLGGHQDVTHATAAAAGAGNLRQYGSAPLPSSSLQTSGLVRASSTGAVPPPPAATAGGVLEGSVVTHQQLPAVAVAAAAAAGNDGSSSLLAQEIQQLQELQARLQQAASQPMVAAAMAAQCWPGITAAAAAAAAAPALASVTAAGAMPVGRFCVLPQTAAAAGDMQSRRSSQGSAPTWAVGEKGAGFMHGLLAAAKRDVVTGYDSAAAAAEPPIVSMQEVQQAQQEQQRCQQQQDAYAAVTAASAAAADIVVESLLAAGNSSDDDDNSGSLTAAARPQGMTDLSSNDLSTSYDEIDTLLSKPDAPFDLSMGLEIPAGLAGAAGYGIFNGGNLNGYLGGYGAGIPGIGAGGWGRGFGTGLGGIFDL